MSAAVGFPKVVLTWWPAESWAERPECALLFHPAARALRLPALREECEARAAAPEGPPEDATWHMLDSAVGQFCWGCEGLVATAKSGSPDERRRRARHLERFSRRHWPGWYEVGFRVLRQSIDDPGRTLAVAELLLTRAPNIAVASKLESLLKWRRRGASRDRLHPLLDALAYAAQGAFYPEEVVARARADMWWNDVRAVLLPTKNGLTELIPLAASAAEQFRAVDRCLHLVDRFASAVDDLSLEGSRGYGLLLQLGDEMLMALDQSVDFVHQTRRSLEAVVAAVAAKRPSEEK